MKNPRGREIALSSTVVKYFFNIILFAKLGSCKTHIFTLRALRLCGKKIHRKDAESAEKRLLPKPLVTTTILEFL